MTGKELMLVLGGAVALAHRDDVVVAASLAAWCRVLRRPQFWATLTPSPRCSLAPQTSHDPGDRRLRDDRVRRPTDRPEPDLHHALSPMLPVTNAAR